ncbi:helix-turn-helix domain-containing protein [Flavobacterium sp. UGB4466]|uniref:helix-turn-helix domain-containing protein n=1 Tax=Flavobacterium sp. UGB4466 TaxID=2730889 RepID=UPI00192C8EBC|nr:helix-turn-helix domain-containing protein [Flavobacterium sp. UGB4466]
MAKLTKQIIPYGMVPNTLLNDNTISLKAKGLFAFMQSKPEGWNFSVDKIAFQCKEAKSSISEGLKELELLGYLVRKKQQTGNGFIVDYHLYFDADNGKPMSDFQSLEIQVLEIPMLENPTIGKSVNNSKKYISKKDNSNKEKREETSLAFFQRNSPSEWEVFQMRFRKEFDLAEWEKFQELFNCKADEESLEYTTKIISARLTRFAINYVENLKKPVKKLISTEVEINHPSRKRIS